MRDTRKNTCQKGARPSPTPRLLTLDRLNSKSTTAAAAAAANTQSESFFTIKRQANEKNGRVEKERKENECNCAN